MGLITKEVIVTWNSKNKKWYESKGYLFTKWKDEFVVKVEDLSDGSKAFVDVQCDGCGGILTDIVWQSYKRYIKEDGKYYCVKCASILYGSNKGLQTKLKNGKSFEKWCLENGRKDILDRWDYELNKCKPSEILFSSNKKYYFKCPRGIHKSELKVIDNFIHGQEGSIECNKCNSFAQWGIDNLGKDFLEKYWDYDKNLIDPWMLSYASNEKIIIICQEEYYHESYNTTCDIFIRGSRCPYCINYHGKVHLLDSLGTLYPQVLEIWSDINKIPPYNYSPKSKLEVYWKCPDDKHLDYKRNIGSSNVYNFRCPECQNSKAEELISICLVKRNIEYIPQKTFDGLIGIGFGLLSYDFYLPYYNLLIEYQGEFHDGNGGKGNYYMKQNLEKQKEHDKRKKQYCLDNNINFLEIWYWDFDNIEFILEGVLDKKKDLLLEQQVS